MIKKPTPRIFIKLQLFAVVILMSSCTQRLAMVNTTHKQLAISQETNSSRASIAVNQNAPAPGINVMAEELAPTSLPYIAPPGTPVNTPARVKTNFLEKKIEKMAIAKIGNKAAVTPSTISKSNAKEHGAYYEHSLRVALVLILVGLLISAFGWPFYAIGGIFVIIGLIFLLFWILDMD